MGARYHRSRELDAYADTAGRARAYMDGAGGTEPGDRARPRRPSSPRSTPPTRRCGSRLAPTRWTPSGPSTRGCGADLDEWEAVSRDTAFD